MLVVHLSLLAGKFEGFLADAVILVHNCLNLLLGCHAFFNEFLAVYIQHVRVFLDDGVHDGLGEHWFIYLVVAEFPVPNQVDDDVPVPG